jgi:hypothetical protein
VRHLERLQILPAVARELAAAKARGRVLRKDARLLRTPAAVFAIFFERSNTRSASWKTPRSELGRPGNRTLVSLGREGVTAAYVARIRRFGAV